MTEIINYAGVAFLAALIIYMLVLIFGALSEGRLARVGAAAEGARGLILESTFSSLPDVAATIYPWLPVRMLMRTQLDKINESRP